MTSTARILLLHASVGMGHQRAAHAVGQALEAAGASEVMLEDTLAHGRAAFRRVYRDLYLRVAERAPTLWSAFYTRTDHALTGTKAVELVRAWGTMLGVRGVPAVIERTQPDAVICTHFLPLEVLGPLRERGGPAVYGVLTDYRAHQFWALPGVDGYFVPTPTTQDQLVEAGVPRARIRITGIPIDVTTSVPLHPIALAAASTSLPTPLVLINGSGLAASRVRAIVRMVLARALPVTLVVAVGRNAALAAALADLRGNRTTTFHVLGPQPSLHPLVAASALVVGKAGGLTVSEVLAHGVPMIIVAPTPGQEQANADYVVEMGAGTCHATAAGVTHAIATLLGDPSRRAAMAAAAHRAARPAAAHTIAMHVLSDIARGYRSYIPYTAGGTRSSVV